MVEMTFDKTYAPRIGGDDLIPQSTLTSVVTLGGLLTPIVDGEGYISHFATCPFAKYHRDRGDG